jgi:hypothetical protein
MGRNNIEGDFIVPHLSERGTDTGEQMLSLPSDLGK